MLEWVQHLPLRLVRAQSLPIVGTVVRAFVWFVLGIDIPPTVRLGDGVVLMHRGVGVVLHRNTVVGDDSIIFPGVVAGIGDVGVRMDPDTRIEIGRYVVIGSGAKLMAPNGGTLVIGDGARIGANAVVVESVPPGEVWGGVPARRLSKA
jgi:serine O-acetyltransferase